MNWVSWLSLNKAIKFLLFHDITELWLNLWCYRNTNFKKTFLRIFCSCFLRISNFSFSCFWHFSGVNTWRKIFCFTNSAESYITRKVSNFFFLVKNCFVIQIHSWHDTKYRIFLRFMWSFIIFLIFFFFQKYFKLVFISFL